MTFPRRCAAAPQLAVVLPFRDARRTLGEAIASLREQTLGDFECVLVDHQSSDDSAAIAAAVAARDPRFRVVPFSGSFAAALNCGVVATRAPLVARMDADDLSHRERFALQVPLFAHDPSLALVGCLVRCFGDAPVPQGMRRYEAWLNGLCEPDEIRHALFVESPLAHPSVVFRRDAFAAAGGYRDDGGPEDYDLWMRVLLAGGRARKVRRVLLDWRDSPQRLTRSDPRYAKARFFATKLRYLPRLVGRAQPLQIWGSGAAARRWARALRAEGYSIRRFVDWIDKRHGSTVQGIAVESIDSLRREDGFVVAAVGVAGARALIADYLGARGFRPGDHYVAVA